MKINQILSEGQYAEIWDIADHDPENIEVLIRGMGRFTLDQIRNKLKNKLQDLSNNMDHNPEAVEKILAGDSYDPFITMLRGYNEIRAQLETPQMKRKRTIYKTKTSQ